MIKKPLLFFTLTIISIGSFGQDKKMNDFINHLLLKMTVDEKIGQLNLLIPGYQIPSDEAVDSLVKEKIIKGEAGAILNLTGEDKIRRAQQIAVTKSRLKIPLFFGLDVIHGYKISFPIPLALSCTWDMKLIEQAARWAARESTADGICWTFSPMVDICRDPRWGRIAEGVGEDVYLGAQVAKALVKGYQTPDPGKNNALMACAKHLALYGAAEAGLDYNTVDMSMVRMYNEYLPPYKAAIDAGASSVMTSFNVINGVPATGNRWLLTDLLRKRWNFKGFVVSDYRSINEMITHGMGDLQAVAEMALHAGVDMDMMGGAYDSKLKNAVRDKRISMQEIDEACKQVLEAKYKLGLFADPFRYCDKAGNKEIATNSLKQAALEVAERSFVLLKNANQLLPLKKPGRIAVVGPLANDSINVLGTWVVPDAYKGVTVLEGIQSILQNEVLYAKGSNIVDDTVIAKNVNVMGLCIEIDKRSPEQLLNEAVSIAGQADVIIAVVGEASEMSGESSSRTNIDLPGSQLNLLKALKSTGKPVVLVIMAGRPLTLNWETENADAILYAWHPGQQAGYAIANVLWGNYNPSGKLTTTFPRSVGQIPIYYNHLNTGKPSNGEPFKKWHANYLDAATTPLYPFGFGLSYTTYQYSEIRLSSDSISPRDKLTATITVANTGNYDGEETVQLYIRDLVGSIARPVKELKAFQNIFLKKGQKKEVSFTITVEDLKFYNGDLKYVAEPGSFKLFIGGNSRDVKEVNFRLL